MQALFLGLYLQFLRASRHLRLRQLLNALKAWGFAMSQAAYRAAEGGSAFPDDAGAFIRALTGALALTPVEVNLLLTLWSFAILCHEVGEPLAREIMGHALDPWWGS